MNVYEQYKHPDPLVIDDELLTSLIHEQGPKGFAGHLAKAEGVPFEVVKELAFHYKNIIDIANLWLFESLTKLQIDNNWIQKINGLDHLVNLKWLDLSFNYITKIENLDKLVNLEDLCLFHNKITVIENLDNLKNLQFLSIGNNRIEDINSLLYLRIFSNLKSLVLVGNPLDKTADYRKHVYSLLPHLIYLDYKMFNVEEINSSNILFAEFNKKQAIEDQSRRTMQKKQNDDEHKYAQDYAAFIENFDFPHFGNLLFSDDPDGERFTNYHVIFALTDKFRQEVGAVANDIYTMGKTKYDERMADERDFWSAINQVKLENQQICGHKISAFLKEKREMWKLCESPEDIDSTSLSYNKLLDKLFGQLVFYEMLCVDQIEDLVKTYEQSNGELIASFKEIVQTKMSLIRDISMKFSDQLTEEAMHLVQMASSPDEIDDIPEELLSLAQDKDKMAIAVQTSHDTHMTKIDQKQDEIYARMSVHLPGVIQHLHEHLEITRNRNKILEINHFIDYQRNEGDYIKQMLLYNLEEH